MICSFYNAVKPIFFAVLIVTITTCSSDNPTAPPEPPDLASIQLSCLISPTPFKAEGQWHLVYEIIVKNQGQTSVEIERVEVFSDNQRLTGYEGTELARRTLTESRTLIAGQTNLIFLWITVTENQSPMTLSNKIKVTGTDLPQTIEVSVDSSEATVIGPPLKGENWLAANISNFSHHRRAAIDFGGTLRIAQRFSIDWVRLTENGQTFTGDPKINANYDAYGARILAVADGVVVAVRDGMSENIPGETPSNVTLDNAGGNWILINIGNNKFALYAHLIPGSIRVQPGQSVNKGDTMAFLGNSGNSTEPHLHFHFGETFDTQRNSGLNTKGLPYVFKSFEIQSGRPVLGKRTLELPLDKAVVRFPELDVDGE